MPSGEEFPRFTEFWIEKPKPNDKHLYRLLSTRPGNAIEQSFAKVDAVTAPDTQAREAMSKPLSALQAWASSNQQPALAELCSEYAAHSQSGITRLLNGPTGERNSYAILPREHVLCLAGAAPGLGAE